MKRLLPYTVRRQMRKQFVSLTIEHLYGPKRVPIGDNEAVVTCVVKNGEFYIEDFIRHYIDMGFRHIYFLDNGSTDKTLKLASKYEKVTIFQSPLHIEVHQGLFKNYLPTRCVRRGWCLDADIDEFFDFPFSSRASLCQLLAYLNSNKYTVMLTYMLDMVSNKRLADLAHPSRHDLKSTYDHYDLSKVRRVPYHDEPLCKSYGTHNILGNPASQVYFGGIRQRLMGSRWSNCLLTKHSLFRVGCGLDLFPHVHFVDRGRIADVAGVLLHYKLTADAVASAEQNREGFPGTVGYYDDIITLMKSDNQSVFTDCSIVKLRNIDQLVDEDFLFASDVFRDYVNLAEEQSVRA